MTQRKAVKFMLKVLFPNGLKKAFTLSYDDGCYDDIRLMGIMSSLGIKGTFNISSGLTRPEGSKPEGPWPRMTPSEIENYKKEGIEVAVHGETHRDFTKISEPELVYEIMSDKAAIERRFETVVRGAAYPYGSFNDLSVEILRHCGIKYCRTVWPDHSMNMPADWLRLRPTAHHNDPELEAIADKFVSEDPKDLRMLYIWGHTPEFNRDGKWDMFAGLLEKCARRLDVWYATNIEICEYDLASKKLEYSAGGEWVYNPTAKEIWLEKPSGRPWEMKTEAVSVKPGETVRV